MAFDVAKIQERIDLTAASGVEVSDQSGGIRFQNMLEVLEFSKMMAVAETAVPKHLRGNPGMCLAVCVQALEWRFSPFAVANKSYVVNDRIGYESQLVHAVIEQRAPIVGRLRHRFEGEGDERICIVWATLRETGETLEYRSPPFAKILPKNSPLWKTKPDLQQYYNTSRDFCRAYFPDVLLGVYSSDELRDHVGPDNAKDVNDRPSVGQRLKSASKGRGFNASHVERETRGVVEQTTIPESNSSQDAPQRIEPETSPATGPQAVAGTPSRTDAQRGPEDNSLPSAPRGDEPRASEQESVTTDSGAVQDRVSESIAPSIQQSSATDQAAGGEGSGADGSQESSSLPAGWEILYAAALRRAQKKDSLAKYAHMFWEERGGWTSFKDTSDGATAAAIFNVLRDNFGNKEQIDLQLREIF